jgi:hypothetical protein
MQNIAEILPATYSEGSPWRQLVMSKMYLDLDLHRLADNNHSNRGSGPRGSRPEP